MGMRAILLAWMAAMFLLPRVDSCRAAEKEWKRFTSKKGDFSVLLPGRPEEEQITEHTSEGPRPAQFFNLEAPTLNFMMSYIDVPARDTLTVPKVALDNYRDNFLQGGKLKLDTEKAIVLNNHPGREFKCRSADKPAVMIVRLYIVRQRYYTLMAGTTTDYESTLAAPTQRFFNSFALLGKYRPPQPKLTWSRFSSTAGGFNVLLPGQPEEIKGVLEGNTGPLDLHTFQLTAGAVFYGIKCTQSSAAEIAQIDPQEFFESYRNAKVQKGRKLVSLKKMNWQGWPGCEYQFADADGFIEKERVFVTKERYYIVWTKTAPKEDSDATPSAKKYFESFRIN